MKFKNTIRFIDCGANIGQSIEWASRTFKDYNLNIDSFEPNSDLYDLLKDKFSTKKNLTLHKTAVSIENSEKDLYLQNWGAKTGSSLILGKESTFKKVYVCGKLVIDDNDEIKEIYNKDGSEIDNWVVRLSRSAELEINEKLNLYDKIKVKTIDLLEWILKNCNPEKETIILKLDVEGAEYEILPAMFNKGFQNFIDVWLIEFTQPSKFEGIFENSIDQNLEEKTKLLVDHYFDWSKPKECEKIFANFMNKIENNH